jgi:lipoprotein signal peptidase
MECGLLIRLDKGPVFRVADSAIVLGAGLLGWIFCFIDRVRVKEP